MIIEGLLTVIYKFLSVALSVVNVPAMPDDYAGTMEKFLAIFDSGFSFFALVFPINVLPFFIILIVLVSVEKLVPLIVWIIRKIPLAGMS